MKKQEIVSNIKDVHFDYLATIGENNSPKVRPIGMHNIYNDCIYGKGELKPRQLAAGIQLAK